MRIWAVETWEAALRPALRVDRGEPLIRQPVMAGVSRAWRPTRSTFKRSYRAFPSFGIYSESRDTAASPVTGDTQMHDSYRFSSLRMLASLLLLVTLTGCGINNIPSYDEQVKSAWAQVENQYQRRADLIPNLVETVKGYARQEQETLTAVIEARAKATSIQVDANTLDDPAKLRQFEQAQDQLSGALSRLMVVVERYPDLKSNQNFLALQSQLEGTENRIAVARRDFIAAVQRYNTEIRTFPGRIWHTLMYSDMPIRETFEATSENAEQAPQVQF
jgi:LemA protein